MVQVAPCHPFRASDEGNVGQTGGVLNIYRATDRCTEMLICPDGGGIFCLGDGPVGSAISLAADPTEMFCESQSVRWSAEPCGFTAQLYGRIIWTR